MNRLIWILLLLPAFSEILPAQNIITGNNFPSPGDAWTRYYGIWLTMGPGLPGSNQVYDFNSATYVGSDTLGYRNASGSPFYTDHPGSQIVKYTRGDIETWEYYKKDANAFWEMGTTLVGDFGNGIDTLHGQYIAPMLVDTLISTAYTYGHTETEVAVNHIVYQGFIDIYQWSLKYISVDGWGSMLSPLTNFDTVLRVKTVNFRYDSIFVFGNFDSMSGDTLFEYNWYAPNVGHPVAKAHANAADSVEYFELLVVPAPVPGCLDPAANNYNPLANYDDGTCIYCSPVSYSITPDTSICIGNQVNISISGGNVWQWNTGDTVTSISVSPDSSQSYSVVFADTMPCWEQASVWVDVLDTVVADAWIAKSWFDTNDSIHFINLSQHATQYLWLFDDQTTSTLQDPVHVFGNTGIHTVQLIASNTCSVDTFEINFEIVPVGIDNPGMTASAMLYPNPSADDVHLIIDLPKAMDFSVTVEDVKGAVLDTRHFNGIAGLKQYELGSGKLPQGIYTITIQTESFIRTSKWIKL